jgi:hypothetical protein
MELSNASSALINVKHYLDYARTTADALATPAIPATATPKTLTVSFLYPRHGDGVLEIRKINVSKVDGKYIEGEDTAINEPRKFLKSKMTSISVDSFI